MLCLFLAMFVSDWEDNNEGVAPKDLTDVNEQFLTAAEDGN